MPWQVRSLSLWDVAELLDADGGEAAESAPASQPAAPISNVQESAWEMRDQVFRRAAALAGVSAERFAAMDLQHAAGWLKALNGQEYPLEKLAVVLAEWSKRCSLPKPS